MKLLTAHLQNASRLAAFAAALAITAVASRADTFVWNGTGVSGGVVNVLLDNPSVLTTWSNSGGPTTSNPGPTDIASISLTSAASLSQTTASLLNYAELFMTATAKSTLTFNGTNTFDDFTANALTTVKILSGMTTITGGATIGSTSFLQLNGTTHIFNADGGLTVRSGGSTDFGVSGGKIVAPVFTNFGLLNSFNTSSVGPIIDAALHNGAGGLLQFRMDTGTGLTDARTLVIEDGVTNAGVIFSWFNRVSGSAGTNIRGLTLTVNNGDFVNLAGSTVTFRNNATTGSAADVVNVGLNVLSGNLVNDGNIVVNHFTSATIKTLNQNFFISGALTNSGMMSLSTSGVGISTTTITVGGVLSNSGSIVSRGFSSGNDRINGNVFNAAGGTFDFTLVGTGAARSRFLTVNGAFANEGHVVASVNNTDTTVNILDRGATLDFLGSVENRAGATISLLNHHTGIAIQTNNLGMRVSGGNLDNDGAINITATDTSASARRAERSTLWVSGVFTNSGAMSLSSQGVSGYAAKILASQITNSGNIYIDKPSGTSAHPVVFGNSAGGKVTFTNEVDGNITVKDSKTALYFSTATLTNKGNLIVSSNAKVALGDAHQTGIITFESGEIQMQTNTGLINNGQIVKTTSGVGAISLGNGLAANNGVINVNGGTLLINHVNTVTGLWHMDSDWTDSSGNGLNGTRFGTGPQFSTTNQKIGSAAGSFNGGNSDYVSVAANDLLNMGPNFAVATWFNVSAISPGAVDGTPDNRQATIVSKGRDLNAGTYRLFYDRISNVFGFGVTFANDPVPRFGQSVGSPAVGILNQWHHIVGQWTNNTLYLYVNGVLTASTSFPDLYVGANEFALEFGKLSQYTYHLTGMVDEAAIFQRALTPSEISAMYNAGAEGFHVGAHAVEEVVQRQREGEATQFIA